MRKAELHPVADKLPEILDRVKILGKSGTVINVHHRVGADRSKYSYNFTVSYDKTFGDKDSFRIKEDFIINTRQELEALDIEYIYSYKYVYLLKSVHHKYPELDD